MTSVAFLVDPLFADAQDAATTYTRHLIPALTRAEPALDVTLFHSRFDTDPPDGWTASYPRQELAASARRLYSSWALARRPPLPLSLASKDLVHSPMLTAVPPAGNGQRSVVTVHDLAFLVYPDMFPRQWRWLARAALARAVRNAAAVIAVSRHTAEDLARRTRLNPQRLYVVPLAPSLPVGSSDVSEVLGRLKVPSPYVLFAGTLEPSENLLRLVRAYRRMAYRGAPHSLVLAGPVGWRPQTLLREISAIDAPGEVVLTGAVDPADLDALYRGAEAFVYPALYEGFALPLIEALARGIPCVASTAASLPEVAGEGALPVDPRSVVGLAEAMERVVSDRDLAGRLRRAGLARAARYSWDETARLTLEVYKWVLSS
jgi:glycosyltransferase involved in cell wall biosynthesis